MIALIQRVSSASVTVQNEKIAAIGNGLLAFVGIEKDDEWKNAEKLAQKMLNYRIFSDSADRMNLNVQQVGGSLLLVSQFTLVANTSKGNRPGFDSAMPPSKAEPFFDDFCDYISNCYPHVARGQFGANMQIELINDGPVTFWLKV